ncbi:MAG: energy transducer TonB [Acidobacteriota bacterium]
MFEQSFMVGRARTRRAWTVPVSFAGQMCLVALAVVFPLIFTEKLPRARLMPKPVTAPVARGTAAPPKGNVVQIVQVIRETRQGIHVPPRIPTGVSTLPDVPAIETAAGTGPVCAGPWCGIPGDPDGVPWAPPAIERAAPAPPPPPPPAVPVKPLERAAPPRIVVGGNVQEAKLIGSVLPVYPPLASRIRVSGVVRLAAVIGTDGRVRELRALSGHPMLIPASMEAVRQWVYSPTLLNGVPVEVATEVLVTFSLN